MGAAPKLFLMAKLVGPPKLFLFKAGGAVGDLGPHETLTVFDAGGFKPLPPVGVGGRLAAKPELAVLALGGDDSGFAAGAAYLYNAERNALFMFFRVIGCTGKRLSIANF